MWLRADKVLKNFFKNLLTNQEKCDIVNTVKGDE
nr:MAG TPA: Dynein light intermediate chain [Caudoviricetes sp.]